MNCINIIKQYLKNNGFDGLYYPGECACKLNDLVPCNEDFSKCIPGYLKQGSTDNFYIQADKPLPTQEKE